MINTFTTEEDVKRLLEKRNETLEYIQTYDDKPRNNHLSRVIAHSESEECYIFYIYNGDYNILTVHRYFKTMNEARSYNEFRFKPL
ncbi:hypothetical protein [Alkalibacillus aidingensis]|uniref:hypothetical protein n=1 Tax=Alkalibacillus aidingensis TaxID=2747607 RepID=UPI0016613A39|nr:hypothetical protein [Alkalibacillus aidingensis]